jgi:hypothetical protein
MYMLIAGARVLAFWRQFAVEFSVQREVSTSPVAVRCVFPDSARRSSSLRSASGALMGDKGGKKDKEKNLQQQVKKHQQKDKEQTDKAQTDKARRAAAPMAARQTAR